jgi:hypothetical protein
MVAEWRGGVNPPLCHGATRNIHISYRAIFSGISGSADQKIFLVSRSTFYIICDMRLNERSFESFLNTINEEERCVRYAVKFGNNCEWCGRIRRSKKCECEMNREARMVARGFK